MIEGGEVQLKHGKLHHLSPRTKHIRKHQVVLYQGELSPAINMVRLGIVRAYTILSSGNEVNAALYGPGDYFPLPTGPQANPVSLFYYETMTDVELVCHEPTSFEQYIIADPSEITRMWRRYNGALLHITALGQDQAHTKILHTLRYLAIRFGQPAQQPGFTNLGIRLTQTDIARLANTARETVNQEIHELKRHGTVIEDNKYYLVDLGQLNIEIGDELPQNPDT